MTSSTVSPNDTITLYNQDSLVLATFYCSKWTWTKNDRCTGWFVLLQNTSDGLNVVESKLELSKCVYNFIGSDDIVSGFSFKMSTIE